jgi:hypothetical protein
MSIFDDLSKQYDAWRARYFDDWNNSVGLARHFANGFKTHISAPDSFVTEPSLSQPSEKGKSKPYVKAMKLKDHGDDTFELVEPVDLLDVIHRGEDGYWRYGISVTLESCPTTWPKQAFGIPIHFIIDDGICTMRITNRPEGDFKFAISDAANYALLCEILRAKPSDQVKEKPQIGFVLPSA